MLKSKLATYLNIYIYFLKFLFLRLGKQLNDLETLKQTNQIIQTEMVKLSQRCNTNAKEKDQLEAKYKHEIDILLADKQRLSVNKYLI